MISRSAPRRLVTGLVVALALGTSACGGSGGGAKTSTSAGADAAYPRTWNGVCAAFTEAQATLQSDVAAAQKAAGGRSAAEQKQVDIGVMSRFFDRSTAALRRAEGLTAPDAFRRFQAQVDRSLPATLSVLKDLKAPLAKGDVQAIQVVVGRLDPTKVFPAIPATLKSQASACSAY